MSNSQSTMTIAARFLRETEQLFANAMVEIDELASHECDQRAVKVQRLRDRLLLVKNAAEMFGLEELCHQLDELNDHLNEAIGGIASAELQTRFSTVAELAKASFDSHFDMWKHENEVGKDLVAKLDDLIHVISESDSSSVDQSSHESSQPDSSKSDENRQAISKNELPEQPNNAQSSAGSSPVDSTIRVDVALLDRLMTRVGELVLARNQILQFTSTSGDSELISTSQRLNLIATELQESVMKTRMQQIGNVWTKFPRLIRDLSAMCGKQVRIEMEGKETELDKTIIEAIKDPLTHLVRNSVDHGIESPQVRLEKGKPAEGCLSLRAYHEGGQVNIEIADDGAGLNYGKIKQKAIDKGLITLEQAGRLQDRDIASLIFLPGFSTADKVSNVSGRGVGMDVVKTNIEKIGGVVDIDSQSGVGTTIRIKIPLTLAIIPALIVGSTGSRFAIPQVNVLELVRLEGDKAQAEIEWVHDAPVYRLRGRLLPLVGLEGVLRGKSNDFKTSEIVNIVVLQADDRRIGLIVDQIADTQEIVVKPLSTQLKNISIYSGATLMGDGKVALILDVMGLSHHAGAVSRESKLAVFESESSKSERDVNSQTLLIVSGGENHRCALPVSQVARLETIARNKIEYAKGREVVQYRGEIMPLFRLGQLLGWHSEPDNEELLNVVVYVEGKQSIGLIVREIIDITESSLQFKKAENSESKSRAAIIDQHVTDIVDLSAIMRDMRLTHA